METNIKKGKTRHEEGVLHIQKLDKKEEHVNNEGTDSCKGR